MTHVCTQLEHVLPPNIRSLELAAVVHSICFRSAKYFLKEFFDVKKGEICLCC